jgi:hypothetical protein
MKTTVETKEPAATPKASPKQTPGLAAERRIEQPRPQRMWSLLLSPTIWSERR